MPVEVDHTFGQYKLVPPPTQWVGAVQRLAFLACRGDLHLPISDAHTALAMPLSPRHSVGMRGVILAFGIVAASCSRPAAPAPAAPKESEVARLMTWDDLLSRPKPSPTHTIKWGNGATDEADLWLPGGSGPYPVVLMV